MNHIREKNFETKAIYTQQYFPVYGPPTVPHKKRALVLQALRHHPFAFFLILLLVLFGLDFLWVASGYAGREILFQWKRALLAGGFVISAIWLYRTMRRPTPPRNKRTEQRDEYPVKRESFDKQPEVDPKRVFNHPPSADEFCIMIDFPVGETVEMPIASSVKQPHR